jgi:NhaA family Na+:H+ antiporter
LSAGVTFSNDVFGREPPEFAVTLGVCSWFVSERVVVYGVSMAVIKMKIANMLEGLTSRHLLALGFLAV